MSKNQIILLSAITIPTAIVIGVVVIWLLNQSTSPQFKLSPAHYSAMVIDQVKTLPCGRATDDNPVTVGAWIVDDPAQRRNRATIAIKVRIADDWYLVKEAPANSPFENLKIQFRATDNVKLVDSLVEPDPEGFDVGNGTYVFLYAANQRQFATAQDSEGYRLLVFQQPIQWSGSARPREIDVQFAFQAFSDSKQTKPTVLNITAARLNTGS